MSGVPARGRTTSGLAQVTNREDAKSLHSRSLGQFLQVTNEGGMAKKASPIAPHGLKARPFRREGHRPLHTARRIGPYSARWAWRRVKYVTPPLGQTLIREHTPDHQHDEPEALHGVLM